LIWATAPSRVASATISRIFCRCISTVSVGMKRVPSVMSQFWAMILGAVPPAIMPILIVVWSGRSVLVVSGRASSVSAYRESPSRILPAWWIALTPSSGWLEWPLFPVTLILARNDPLC